MTTNNTTRCPNCNYSWADEQASATKKKDKGFLYNFGQVLGLGIMAAGVYVIVLLIIWLTKTVFGG